MFTATLLLERGIATCWTCKVRLLSEWRDSLLCSNFPANSESHAPLN